MMKKSVRKRSDDGDDDDESLMMSSIYRTFLALEPEICDDIIYLLTVRVHLGIVEILLQLPHAHGDVL